MTLHEPRARVHTIIMTTFLRAGLNIIGAAVTEWLEPWLNDYKVVPMQMDWVGTTGSERHAKVQTLTYQLQRQTNPGIVSINPKWKMPTNRHVDTVPIKFWITIMWKRDWYLLCILDVQEGQHPGSLSYSHMKPSYHRDSCPLSSIDSLVAKNEPGILAMTSW